MRRKDHPAAIHSPLNPSLERKRDKTTRPGEYRANRYSNSRSVGNRNCCQLGEGFKICISIKNPNKDMMACTGHVGVFDPLFPQMSN